MKIVLVSRVFHPAVGGIETMSLLLAHEFIRRGHEVVVVTETANPEPDVFPFRVIRKPSALTLLQAVRWSDVFFQNNISLHTLWPLIFVRRPWVVRHATWIRRNDGSLGWQDRIKRALLRFSTGISNSRAVAEDLPVVSTVIGNPYQVEVFRRFQNVQKDRDIVFLGRLVSDKGPALLMQALRDLRQKGLLPTATFIGSGPELGRLQQMAADWQLEAQIVFAGQQSGEDLAGLLNRHRIMAVPSVWNEPFGIVALEGIACGCVVVGTEGGGLKEAIGPCGLTVRNGDADDLAAALERLLRAPDEIARLLAAAPAHLARHTLTSVSDRYLRVLESALVKH